MSNISKEQVNHIAKLSQLPLKEGEAEIFSDLLSDTLSYIDILNELDTTSVKETYQVTGLVNIFQKDDENVRTLTQEQALQNAKEIEKGLVVTKGVFDRE